MGAQPDTGDQSAPTVAVLGGGLAGLSAARCLLKHGLGVVLIEKRPFLGGRAYSFRDRDSGVEIDNGQHVFLGCNSYFIDYLCEIGAMDKAHLQGRLSIPVVRDGVEGSLFSVPWLGPAHLLPSFVRYRHLSVGEKLQAAYGLMMAKLTRRSSPGLDQETAYEWLRRHGQSDRTIRNLWNLVILPALNDDVRNVSASMALMVLKEALLRRPSDARVGFALVGLTAFAGEPAQEYIDDRGGRLLLGRTSSALKMSDGRIEGIELSDGSVIDADAYVSALPFDALLRLLPPDTARDAFFSPASELTTAPIVGVHLWYDRPIMDEDFVAFLDSPVQWVFNKSRIMEAPGDGQYVYISLSGAWEHIDESKDSLKSTFASEMARLFPRARRAKITRSFVVKEPRATFRSTPGASSHRLSSSTPIPNLFLAGDWTDTGWPSTMEGAVRSGVFAADAAASWLTRSVESG